MNCGKCRDWYFTGDRETWKWVRNCENWKDADWKRYYNDRIYEHFKRRDGYSCGFRAFRYAAVFDVFGAFHCFCEDNVRP